MLLTKHRKVRALNEDLNDLGIDSEKFTGQVDKMTGALVEGSAPDGTWKGSPPLPAYGVGTSRLSGHVESERSLLEADDDEDLFGGESLTEDQDLDEAAQFVKSALTKKGKKQDQKKHREGKKEYRQGRGQKRAAARISRKSRRASIKRTAKRRKAMGLEGGGRKQKALARAGKSIRMHDDLPDLDQLREDVETMGAPDQGPYFEAAFQASEVALHLADIFEEVFEEESAQVMSDLFEEADALAASLDGVDELDEAQEERLNSVLESVLKGLRFHEAMGAPSIQEACEFHLYKESLQEDEDTEADDDDDFDFDFDLSEDDDLDEVGDEDEDGPEGNDELDEV